MIKFGVKLFVDYYGAGLEGRSDEALDMLGLRSDTAWCVLFY